jgi:hypothetical protein
MCIVKVIEIGKGLDRTFASTRKTRRKYRTVIEMSEGTYKCRQKDSI